VINNVSRVAFEWDPFPAVNVMHFHQDDIDPDGLFGVIASHVSQIMWAVVDIGQTIGHVVITPLDGTSTSGEFVTDRTAKWKGGATGGSIPGSAGVLSLHTAMRGRSNRGRAYLGPLGEGFQVGGLIDSAQITATTDAWDAFGAALIDDGAEHVVASYLRATALTVTQYSMRHAAGTMRRRQDSVARANAG
jgi:hypothetical protein